MIKNRSLKLWSLVALLFISATKLYAQENVKAQFAPINTAVPSLSIAPDARGGGMGDNGVATLPDVNSQYWNPAKYVFNYSQAGVSLSYTPWLRKLVNDVALVNLSGYYKLGSDDRQAIGASLRYFSFGEVQNNDENSGATLMTLNPYEMALDVSYSRKLSEAFSMAVALRYIRSDQGADPTAEMVPGNAFSADIAGYLERYVIMGQAEALWSFGFNVSNIGTKISYDGGGTNQFLPTKLSIGTGLLYPIDDYNQIGAYVDLSKYLVPSEPQRTGTTQEDEQDYNNRVEEYNSMSSITGMFKSFGDSPLGFKGELQEIMASIGIEYSYNQQFFVRGGYYYENENMGNRQYFSFGAGFRMSVFQLDAAYLVSTVPSNPLDQTLRFSLSFDMDGIKNLFK
ncbi:type IX secretion system outer membrane channel protein PorV [Parabacteroides sp. AD58]|uniref:Type IX secretion system outer membrane channel protein PorV n=1 Tax=Parabacteroides absconsus TaxID=2951805 RepID=A0ABZ2IHB6_9BACT|nr:type IX secretion system outer membrane channel protein PorV [Parabacteroides sp. AD58]MCM6902700.1 type IX secretion system outer membrane channel protein PorV [Parabacteroides sp. AD58]